MTAVAADLRRHFPDARIVLLLGPSNAGLGPLVADADEWIMAPIKSPVRTVALLRRQSFDILIDFGPWARTNAVCCALARPRFTIGYRTPGQYRHFAYDRSADHSPDRHELENQRELLRAVGLSPEAVPRLTLSSELDEKTKTSELAGTIVFHPWPGGSGRSLKQWPVERWVDLAHRVSALGHRIAVTGAPFDASATRELVATINLPGDKVLNLAGKLSLEETATSLKHAAAVVSVNTGIMHMAAVLGSRLVGLHGPTSAERWGPIGPRSVAITPSIPGCGYLKLGFEFPRRPPPCMEAIGVDVVFAALQEVMAMP
ncbi:MAG: glycosyltransferase family 9 protein [Kiloniellaceae bacterium]